MVPPVNGAVRVDVHFRERNCVFVLIVNKSRLVRYACRRGLRACDLRKRCRRVLLPWL
ncbi:hypothetical protein FRAHR75_2030003 [Frankia sp. Hr75.2]|nr:hypothetical protein FRAHR75_2030003 [Frankia sp. Hr75.2]